MMPLRLFLALPVLLFLTAPARACWQAPSATCFAQLWQEEALAYHAEGPKIQRLYNLIDWGAVPPGEATARALLQDLSYDELVAFHAADQSNTDATTTNAEHALRLLLGLSTDTTPPEVSPAYLLDIYLLSLVTNDPNLSSDWYQRLPDYMQNAPDVPSPDGEPENPDPYVAAQDAALAVLTDLRDGRVDEAAAAAANLEGEPGFLVWRALARHAIATDDIVLLTRAAAGLNATLSPQDTPPLADEAFERAMQAAEAEFARTGDPDALAHALESADASAYSLPVGARITAALAQRHVSRLAGRQGEDGFDAALQAMRQALLNMEDEDDATPMLNARTALRLGLEGEARQLIDMVEASFPGVPGFFLYDLPDRPEHWANDWLDLMITRFDTIVANPDAYHGRDYWGIWLDQDALNAAIEITQRLVLYERRDAAQDFADRAMAYLKSLPTLYPGAAGTDLVALFDGETAAFLYPPDVAIPRMRRIGMDETLIQYAFAKAGRPVIALKLLEGQEGYRNLSHWMKHASELQDPWRAEYIDTLAPLIAVEGERLIEQGYPDLSQTLHAQAAAFWVAQGNWPAAQRHYEKITNVTGDDGSSSGMFNRLVALRDIVAALSPQPAPVQYPYDDFAL
jgi:hypothetical protein